MGLSRVTKICLGTGAVVLATYVHAGLAISAPTAELAKKCREMMIKAYPPLPPGSKSGNAQQQQEYFRTCIAQNGKMKDAGTPPAGRDN